MQVNSIQAETLQQNFGFKAKNVTSPIKNEEHHHEGYAPITAKMWGAKAAEDSSQETNSSFWAQRAIVMPAAKHDECSKSDYSMQTNFEAGRVSNNPVGFDPIEADTQAGFRLSQLEHPLICPDCGKPIMTKPIFSAIKEELNNADEANYLDVVKSHGEFLYPQEQRILAHIENMQKKYPDMSVRDVVEQERLVRLDKLETEQYKVLDKIEEIGEVLDYEDRSKVTGLITVSSKVIFQRQNTYAFQRGKFIDLVNKLDLKTEGIKEQLLEVAQELPSAMNNEDAWYVKYGGVDSKKQPYTSRAIAEKLLAPTYTNTDHVHPWNLGGLDAVSNFWLMHARCNIIKTDKPFVEWLNEDRDNRIGYIKEYLTSAQEAIDESTDKKMHPKYDLYSAKLAKTIYDETNGEVDFTKDFPLPEGYDVPKPGPAPKDAKKEVETEEV